jgi:hypothetical protein
MIDLIYVSAARISFSRVDLSRLLQKARVRNAALGVSGMLVYESGSFLQVIEGDASVIKGLYAKIAADTRHHRLVKLLEGTLEKRNFADWSMGFANVDPGERGASELMSQGFSPAAFLRGDSPSKAKEVLMAFRQGRFHAHVDADASLVEAVRPEMGNQSNVGVPPR